MIAFDSVIANLYRHNVVQHNDHKEEDGFDYFSATLDQRFFRLDEDNNFIVHPNLITALKKHALTEHITEDHVGRTENRGCPFLVSKIQDEFISFAIEEFIGQHKKMVG